MEEQELAAIELEHDHAEHECSLWYWNGAGEQGCWVADLVAEVRRLRGVMREVYEAGRGHPGNQAAATVEPLWKALQREV